MLCRISRGIVRDDVKFDTYVLMNNNFFFFFSAFVYSTMFSKFVFKACLQLVELKLQRTSKHVGVSFCLLEITKNTNELFPIPDIPDIKSISNEIFQIENREPILKWLITDMSAENSIISYSRDFVDVFSPKNRF